MLGVRGEAGLPKLGVQLPDDFVVPDKFFSVEASASDDTRVRFARNEDGEFEPSLVVIKTVSAEALGGAADPLNGLGPVGDILERAAEDAGLPRPSLEGGFEIEQRVEIQQDGTAEVTVTATGEVNDENRTYEITGTLPGDDEGFQGRVEDIKDGDFGFLADLEISDRVFETETDSDIVRIGFFVGEVAAGSERITEIERSG